MFDNNIQGRFAAHLDLVVVEGEVADLGELVQPFDLGDAVEGEIEPREVHEVIDLLDLFDLVVVELQFGEAIQRAQVFDLLNIFEAEAKTLDLIVVRLSPFFLLP
jgi:hypothetical protein